MMRQKALTLAGTVEHRHEATPLLRPGAAVLVRRGVDRSLVLRCPDGCGEELTVNLDSRSGPAWRCYAFNGGLSLFPSVWRHSGCRSHFIVWRSRIYWCDWEEELEAPAEATVSRVQVALTAAFRPYHAIALSLDLVPWEVLSAGNVLVRRGLAERRAGEHATEFRTAKRHTGW